MYNRNKYCPNVILTYFLLSSSTKLKRLDYLGTEFYRWNDSKHHS